MSSKDPNSPRKNSDQSQSVQNSPQQAHNNADAGSSVAPKEKPSPTKANSTKNREGNTKHWGWRAFEIVLGLSAIGYAIVTYCMWKDSHRNFVVDERSWVDFDTHFPNKETIKSGMELEVDIATKNIGKTAAKQIRYEFCVVDPRSVDAVDFSYPPHTTAGFGNLVNPNRLIVTQVRCNRSNPLNTEEADDLLGGRRYMAIYGRGEYRDIFDEFHWFHFCDWVAYYSGTSAYNTAGCTSYTDTGDGKLPELHK